MRRTYPVDMEKVKIAWKKAGYKCLKDVFRDENGDENHIMRYDSALKRIKSGVVSYSIIDFLSERLSCSYEELAGTQEGK